MMEQPDKSRKFHEIVEGDKGRKIVDPIEKTKDHPISEPFPVPTSIV
jgi:hypothetical protein